MTKQTRRSRSRRGFTLVEILMVIVIIGLLAAFVGGITRVEGVILGGFILGMIEAVTAGTIPGGYHNAIAPLALVIIFLIRRRGLLATAGKG